MRVEQATVLDHAEAAGGYNLLTLHAPGIVPGVLPGQFVHLRVPRLEQSVLRRPFSIYRADDEKLGLLYKQIGAGTRALAEVRPGDTVSLVGPLGNGFPLPGAGAAIGLVAGGYGVAPLRLLASRLDTTGTVFIGGRTAADILCVDDFTALGWDVHVTTEDGSLGRAGRVTVALDDWLPAHAAPGAAQLYACGPDGLLKAVGARAIDAGHTAWLSLDKRMGCGVGACLACVQRIRMPDGAVRWKRVCKDGPIFEAREIVWDA